MSEQGNIPIAQDLRELWENAQRGIRHIQAHPELDVKVAGDTVYRVATLIERCSRAEAEVTQLKADRDRLRNSLELVYDRWENGVQVHEVGEDGVVDEGGSSLGNALKLDFAEEQEILNLIVDKAEDFEQACANCNKPYRAHLLHDGDKCGPNGPAWFPGKIADALLTARTGGSNGQ